MKASIRNWILPVLVAAGATAQATTPASRRVEFTTGDGVVIVGDYTAGPDDARATPVILLHMYRSNRQAWQPLINPLHAAGFAVLAIDLRGHGDSTQPAARQLAKAVVARDAAVFQDMHRDVSAAVKWIRQQPRVDQDSLVLVGASVGCSVAIDHGRRHGPHTAVVCMTPGTGYLGLDSVSHLPAATTTPMLLLATEDERAAVDTLARLSPMAEGRILGPGRIHGTRMFGQVEGVTDLMVAYIVRHTGAAKSHTAGTAAVKSNDAKPAGMHP